MAFAVLGLAMGSCSKEPAPTDNNGGNNNTTPKVSKMGMLCKSWILKETYVDGQQGTQNGTDQYRFSRDGKFDLYKNGAWNHLGTWNFNDKDSNSISMLFVGTSMSYWWTFTKFEETHLNTEFIIQGKKYNYHYVKF